MTHPLNPPPALGQAASLLSYTAALVKKWRVSVVSLLLAVAMMEAAMASTVFVRYETVGTAPLTAAFLPAKTTIEPQPQYPLLAVPLPLSPPPPSLPPPASPPSGYRGRRQLMSDAPSLLYKVRHLQI